jgi:hypothetical protein
MTSYEDDQLIGDYLYANPPLHPRRTLHQSFNEYANFLRDTKKLDQDQIVYRATAKVRDTTRQGCSKWCQCPDCTAERSTVSRLLMVDQLWVFVLDESEYPRDRHLSCVPNQGLTFQTPSSPASPNAGVPTLLVIRPECTLVCGIS